MIRGCKSLTVGDPTGNCVHVICLRS